MGLNPSFLRVSREVKESNYESSKYIMNKIFENDCRSLLIVLVMNDKELAINIFDSETDEQRDSIKEQPSKKKKPTK